jgi:hypothetical protein
MVMNGYFEDVNKSWRKNCTEWNDRVRFHKVCNVIYVFDFIVEMFIEKPDINIQLCWTETWLFINRKQHE